MLSCSLLGHSPCLLVVGYSFIIMPSTWHYHQPLQAYLDHQQTSVLSTVASRVVVHMCTYTSRLAGLGVKVRRRAYGPQPEEDSFRGTEGDNEWTKRQYIHTCINLRGEGEERKIKRKNEGDREKTRRWRPLRKSLGHFIRRATHWVPQLRIGLQPLVSLVRVIFQQEKGEPGREFTSMWFVLPRQVSVHGSECRFSVASENWSSVAQRPKNCGLTFG